MKKRDESYEGSEEERFQKALAKCRHCKHIKMAHSFLGNLDGKCIDSKLTVKGIYNQCLCELYEPQDNLEYLEWVAARREKRK